MSSAPERWMLTHEGVAHEVEITDKGIQRSAAWRIDGTEVASKATSDKRLVLEGGERGAVGLRLPEFVGPARRVTFYSPDTEGVGGASTAAHAGLGGLDFDPEPGSAAAKREEWIRAHPNLHSLRRTLTAAAGIALPFFIAWLLSKIVLPSVSIPWPDWDIPWPTIPWPDWSISWPDWDIPWPELNLPPAPPWVGTLLDVLKIVVPILIAFVVARMELRRRRAQDERKKLAAGRAEKAVAEAAESTDTVDTAENASSAETPEAAEPRPTTANNTSRDTDGDEDPATAGRETRATDLRDG